MRWLAVLVLVGCGGPVAGEVCDVSEGAVCDGRGVLLCVCAAVDAEGECVEETGTWAQDSFCSCDLAGNMVCS